MHWQKKDSPRQDATALLRKLESDSEDFSELEADKLWILVCVACFDQALRTVGKGVWFLRWPRAHYHCPIFGVIFSQSQRSKRFRNTICVMEGIASLGQGSGDCCFQSRLECCSVITFTVKIADWTEKIMKDLDFRGFSYFFRLRSWSAADLFRWVSEFWVWIRLGRCSLGSLDTCLARLKQVSAATDLASLPRTHEIIRWQSKINAWNAIKPDWAKQMSLLIEAHCEQAKRQTLRVHNKLLLNCMCLVDFYD